MVDSSDLALKTNIFGVPQSLERGGEVANMDGGGFEVAQGSSAQVIGTQVAKAVYGELRE